MSLNIVTSSLYNSSEAIAVPVNLEGKLITTNQLKLRNKCPYWYFQYYNACTRGLLKKKGYWVTEYLNRTLVSIPERLNATDKCNIDLLIENLLKFNSDFDDVNHFHWIDELRLPLIGCGLNKKEWKIIQDKLEEALKDTFVTFTFCVPYTIL